MFKYVVPIPRDKKLKNIRKWLLDNVGESEVDWAIGYDYEVVEFFSSRTNPHDSRVIEIFNIGFKNEEDKVKFILSFL